MFSKKRLLRGIDFGMFFRTTKRTLILFWQFDRLNMLSYFALIVAQVGSNLGAIYIVGRIINGLVDYLQNGNTTKSTIITYTIVAAALGIIEQVSWRLMGYVERRSYYKWHIRSISDFNVAISGLDVARFEDKEYSNTINKLRQDGHSYKPANFAYGILRFLHALIRTLSAAIIILQFAAWIAVVVLLTLIPGLLVQSREAKLNWGIWGIKGDTNRRFWKITNTLQEKDELKEVRTMGLQTYLLGYAQRMLKDFVSEQHKVLNRFIKPAIATRVFEGVVVLLVEIWLISKVLNRNAGFGIGNYTFYSGVINQFSNSSGLIISTLSDLYTDMLFIDDFYKFLDTTSELNTPEKPVYIAKNAKPSITFENVWFKYPSSNRYIFKDLSLTIPYGEHIALVGENGAGKTTLINLMLRFYDVSKGRILIDGHDIRTINIDSWRQHVGVLFQSFNRYPFSIANNIWLGRVENKKVEAETLLAAKAAGVDGFVNKLPLGYDSILDNSFSEGVEPSGGQWQRVALARAFYRKAGVLILDEPTSAIDAKAEYEIFERIRKSQAEHTTIIVSHRFSTVRNAQRIIVFENGKIIEQGSHKELVSKKGGTYKSMFDMQAEGYR